MDFLEPYIGITDFTNFEQVKRMLKIFRKNKPSQSRRILHIGVMMSFKTLNNIETKWSKIFPPKEDISKIFSFHKSYPYYCLHYADYDDNTTFTDISRGLGYAGPAVRAIQFDMPWPEPEMIANGVHASRKQVEVILQIGRNALEEAGNDPKEVVDRLEDYKTVVDRVLLDKSMGRGLGMDAVELIPFAQAIRNRFPDIGLVCAGGLGPNSMNLVEPLVKEFPNISIDAQGKLRPSVNALDPIDWDMAEEYLVKALKLLP